MTDDAARASAARREKIRELLIEELASVRDVEDGEIVTHWVALVGLHRSVDDDEGSHDDGQVVTVRSTPSPPLYVELGLMEARRLHIQGCEFRHYLRDEDS